jgi:drug/metabolite transporter (DMT)-like permease
VASMQRLKDWALLILANGIWASQFVMVKLVQREMGPIFATFFPMTLATLILIPVVRHERRKNPAAARGPMPWRDVLDFVLIGVLGQVVAQLLITWGTGISLASNAALLMLTLPIATCVMAYLFLGERMTLLRIISFALALLGVLASSGIDLKELNLTDKRYFWGNILIFLSINGSAFYNVYSKKLMTRYTPLQVLLYSYYAVFVFMLPITIYLEPTGFADVPHFGLTVWFGLFVLAVFQYALAMVIFLHVLSRLDATQAGLMNYLIPFLGVVIAWAVLGETLTLFMILGGILALGSTLLATVFDKEQGSTLQASVALEAEMEDARSTSTGHEMTPR